MIIYVFKKLTNQWNYILEKGVKIEYDSDVTNIELDKNGQIESIQVNGDKTYR